MTHQSNLIGRFTAWRGPGFGLILVVLLLVGAAVPLTLAAPAVQESTELWIAYLGGADSDAASGAQLAIDQINTAGGVRGPDGVTYTLKLVTLSGAPTSPEELRDAIGELSANTFIAILGPDATNLLTPEAIQDLADLQLPVLTGATGDTLTDSDTSDTLFRIRAAERFYSAALATYMTADLGLQNIALVQTDIEATEALVDFENSLGAVGLQPADRILGTSGTPLTDEAQRLLDLNPDGVVMWGTPQDVVTLLRQLRDSGWNGRFAYRHAEEAARAGGLPDDLAEGVLGANSWSYAYSGRATSIFLRDYVLAFGQVPGPLSAAAYDAIWYLRGMIAVHGPDTTAIREGLKQGTALPLVQGTMRPAEFGNGDMVRMAVVYELGAHGGPTVVARYDDTNPLPVEGEGGGEEIAEVPTATPPPTEPPVPTATLEGAWATVTANVLNVRTGPGFNYDKIGQVSQGDVLRILGAIPDYSWLNVDYQGGVGWIKTEYTETGGDLATVIVLQPPPTPTLAATPTFTIAPYTDLVIDTVVLNPAQPVPNKPFTATVTIRNTGGGAAGQFSVAATFEPGSVYTSAFVNGLAGGQSTQVQLTGTLIGTGVFTVAVIADLNNEVQENNENNNMYNITYRADYPLYADQAGQQLTEWTDWDLYGGTVDFTWDGYNIAMQNGATMGILGGTTYENAHYDALTPAVINNATGVGTDKVNTGVVIGIYTAEGKRAVMRIDNRQGTTIWISYRVYNDTP
ncbi:MAG: ABC transporter substrate-binding protein [Anaerolineae bacterium]|nr:ABC transporter substrate-binding protein [Anaerolineae bacterium]